MLDLDASDKQLDAPIVFASAKEGYAVKELKDEHKDLTPLFDTIIKHIPGPEGDPDKGTQVMISTIDYNDYVGRIGVGKVDNGTIRVGQELFRRNAHNPDTHEKVKITKLYGFSGLDKVDVREAEVGHIVALSGLRICRSGYTLFRGNGGNSVSEDLGADDIH